MRGTERIAAPNGPKFGLWELLAVKKPSPSSNHPKAFPVKRLYFGIQDVRGCDLKICGRFKI